MTFRPLFFLPRAWLRWAYIQAISERLFDTPFGWLFTSWDKHGIWFTHKGDEVMWTWPWRRGGLAPFISMSMSGTGEFGDARFRSLGELDDAWNGYFAAISTLKEIEDWDVTVGDAIS